MKNYDILFVFWPKIDVPWCISTIIWLKMLFINPQISAFFHKSFFQSGILQSVTSRYLTMSVPSSQYLKETLLDFFRDWQLSDQSEFTFDFEILIKVKQCKVSNIIALWMSILHFKTTFRRGIRPTFPKHESAKQSSQAKNAIKQQKN